MPRLATAAAVLLLTYSPDFATGALDKAEALALAAACGADDARASEGTSLLQHAARPARGRASSPRAQEKPQRKLTVPLVDAVYTYGAPATHRQPIRNAATEDECFPGLRSYTEDLHAFDSIKQVDAASINNFFPHAATNSVVLRWKRDSLYTPCKDHLEWGHPDWPKRGAQVYQEWRLHHESTYTDRLNAVTVNGKEVAEEEPFKAARFFLILAFKSYDTVANTKAAILEKMPGWKLVDRVVYKTFNDEDPVMVVQSGKTLDCAFVFTGTNNFADLPSSTTSYGTGYCGFQDVHVGYRNELWTLTKNVWGGLRADMEKCNRVTCVGHSLGGALCELFAACANSGNFTDPDYQLLAWKKGTPQEMPEMEG